MKTEPFLHRLFSAEKEGRRTRLEASIRAAVPTRLADIEPGKIVLSWDGGQVLRGVQKSLDRPVLLWQDTTPAAPGAPLPGVFVRHPCVLGLHAAGAGPEGRFVVTEFVAATPLVELLDRDGLQPRDAVHLAIALAEAVQAVHDQGACFGSLRPEWVLVRSGLEPLLCPCCVPSQSELDKARDCSELGRRLSEWLPPRPGRWHGKPIAAVYEVADAAVARRYTRTIDLAADLRQALSELTARRRERWLFAGTILLGALAWLGVAIQSFFAPAPLDEAAGSVWRLVLPALAPCATLLGFFQARVLERQLRSRRSLPLGSLLRRLGLPLLMLIVPPALTYGSRGLLAAGLLVGFWLLGILIAGLATAAKSFLDGLRISDARMPLR